MRKGGGGGGKRVDRAHGGEMESGRQKHRPRPSVKRLGEVMRPARRAASGTRTAGPSLILGLREGLASQIPYTREHNDRSFYLEAR